MGEVNPSLSKSLVKPVQICRPALVSDRVFAFAWCKGTVFLPGYGFFKERAAENKPALGSTHKKMRPHMGRMVKTGSFFSS